MIDFNIPLPSFEIFLVGGYVRDHLMGLPSKDIDIVCEASSFEEMLSWILDTHKKVFMANKEFLTVRALSWDNKPYDYVLTRKESGYSDGRHPDEVFIGTILEDLARRDFTINSLAWNINRQELLDPHNGKKDIDNKKLNCVGNTFSRFEEDPLRILRAMRFSITKGFLPNKEILSVFKDSGWVNSIIETVSEERIQDELKKCFFFNSAETMRFLVEDFHHDFIFQIFKHDKSNGALWLEPTSKLKA